MKKLMHYISIIFFFSFVQKGTTQYTPVEFIKTYGDINENKPKGIKAFDDGIYVIGTVDISGTKFGTVSKFDITTGNLLWDHQANTPSVYNDFELDTDNNQLLIVGRTEPFNANTDNESLLHIIETTSGQSINGKRFFQDGREQFHRILFHPGAPDPDFPFFIVGTKNPSNNTPSDHDIPVIYNVNFLGDVKWNNEYDEPGATTEYEVDRGLYPVANGVVMLGNDQPDNYGVIIRIAGSTGDVSNSYKVYDELTLLDGIELSFSTPGNQMIVAGTHITNQEAVLMVLEPTDYQCQHGLIFTDISEFTEVMLDGNGGIYAIGPSKSNPDLIIVNRLYDSGNDLVLDYSRYIEDNETDYANGHFFINPDFPYLYYTDARLGNPIGFGNYDMMVATFDLEMTGNCVKDFTPNPTSYYCAPIDFFSMEKNVDIENSDVDTTTINLNYSCIEVCAPNTNCAADFDWDAVCYDNVTLFGIPLGGVPPYTWEWDFFCDGITDATTQNVSASFACVGALEVCLKFTDATGCTINIQKHIVLDDQPPVINCPADIVVSTDPGVCSANLNIPVPATDNCDPTPAVICVLSGATSGNNVNTDYNTGITTVTCFATDCAGNTSPTCSFKVTVEDDEAPQIYCPSLLAPIVVPSCSNGTVVNYAPPITGDNCGILNVTCDPPSGSFFTCGTTMVTCIAEDIYGNWSTCTFPVIIECECADVVSQTIDCGVADNTYTFSITIENTGGGFNCSAFVNSPQPGITISNFMTTYDPPTNQYTLEGIIHYNPPPVPGNIIIDINLACECIFGGFLIPCPLSVELIPPCCETISIDEAMVCKDATSLIIPLIGNLYDVQKLTWEVSDGPCPGNPWVTIQETHNYQDLEIFPNQYSGDICIRAKVEQGSAAGVCNELFTQEVTISLCEPVSCTIPEQEFCYTGNSIIPAPLVATIVPANPNCGYSIQWYDDNNAISGETGLTYQPPAVNYTGSATDCYQDITRYKAIVSSECGDFICEAKIRLFNNDAPAGEIVMNPLEPTPFCPKEDAELWFNPGCLDEDDPSWEWLVSTDGWNYTSTQNGTSSAKYNTNQLDQDTWFAVTSTNGTCAEDTVFFPIEVYEKTVINNFSVSPMPSCAPTYVDMLLDFSPSGIGCGHTIEWYRNTTLLHTTNTTISPVQFTYSGPEIDGNYYVVIYNNCCPESRVKSTVITVHPPVIPIITGPCYICVNEDALLEGALLNLPSGVNCTFKWYDDNGLIPGETNPDILVKKSGNYTFVATCTNGCTYTASFYLGLGCSFLNDPSDSSNRLENNNSTSNNQLKVYPNPTSGQFNVSIKNPEQETATIKLFDSQGKMIWEQRFNRGEMPVSWEQEFNLPPAKMYFLWAQIGKSVAVEKVVVLRL